MEVTTPARPGAPHEGTVLSVREQTQVGEARRMATALSGRLGLDQTASGKAAIIATEAAGNLVKHGHGGELILRQIGGPHGVGIEMIALDRGPGIGDVGRSLQDGFSTAGTPGTGLGAIQRLSSEFDLYSAAGRGTAVLSRVYTSGETAAPPRLQAGAICLPKAGEFVSGDAWHVRHRVDGARLVVVDGLGHGPEAHKAARQAVDAAAAESGGPAEVVEACHGPLRSTRGAALAVADVDVERCRVRFAGVGNVTGVVIGSRRQNMVSLNGTAGQGTLRAREFEYAWEPGGVLIMASDGLGTRWALEDYPGLARRHPALVAAVLYRDHTRGRDDVTVVAVRERPRAEGAAW